LWHSLRPDGLPKLATPERGIERVLAFAMIEGINTVFIDTAPTMWVVVQEAIKASTLVLIPARPGFFDLDAVRETVKVARERNKPYAVVINAAPVKRDDKESALVTQSRAYLAALQIPVWAGQISQRAGFQSTLAAGASAAEMGRTRQAGVEVAALWRAVERSIAGDQCGAAYAGRDRRMPTGPRSGHARPESGRGSRSFDRPRIDAAASACLNGLTAAREPPAASV
jgi:chromosome partitioning protein